MENQIYEFEFVEPGLIENPHYQSHKRGKNWASVISGKNSVQFKRENLRQSFKLVVADSLKIGDALELGGDYITSGGNREPDRGYYLITEITDTCIKAETFTSIAELLKAKNERVKNE
jgi:hypothetical protein